MPVLWKVSWRGCSREKRQARETGLTSALCIRGWYGVNGGTNCEPCNGLVNGTKACSGHGICNGDGVTTGKNTGKCTCDHRYYGDGCATCNLTFWGVCPASHVMVLLCTIDDSAPSMRADCPQSPIGVCSGHGKCKCTGDLANHTACECAPNFVGDKCESCALGYTYVACKPIC